MAGAHPLSSESEERVGRSPTALIEAPLATPTPDAADRRPAGIRQPRVLIALLLIVAGVVWAVVRGLHGYGISTMNVVYDLDQPPLLLILAGAWLCYRSQRA